MTDEELDAIERFAATAGDAEFLSGGRSHVLRLTAEVRRLRKPVETARVVKEAREHFAHADNIRMDLYGELKELERRLDDELKAALAEPEHTPPDGQDS